MLSLLLLASGAAAVPFFNYPTQVNTLTAGTTYNATWHDNSWAPPTAKFGKSRMDLCTGTTTAAVCPLLIDANFDPDVPFHTFTIPPGIGENGPYFIRIQSLKTKVSGHFGVGCTYSFQVTGMTGPNLALVPTTGGACFYSASGSNAVPNKVPAAVAAAAKQTAATATAAGAPAKASGAAAAAPAAATTGVIAAVAGPAAAPGVAAVNPGTSTVLAVVSAPAVSAPPPSSGASVLRPACALVLAGAVAYFAL